jgi:hypothetical protein
MNNLIVRYRNWKFRQDKKLGAVVWKGTKVLNKSEVSDAISKRITDKIPFAAGKLGGNERVALEWGTGFKNPLPWIGNVRTFYPEVHGLTTNAGISPSGRRSYKTYVEILKNSLCKTDILGYLSDGLQSEFLLMSKYNGGGLWCCGGSLHPTYAANPWTHALKGKTVFAVSPFLDSFKRQQETLAEVWRSVPGFMPSFKLIGYRFPYLIEPSNRLTWQETYEEVKAAMRTESYDVALFGCGALGLPLAVYAKEQGRCGIHLGGALQMLFGVKGGRHLQIPEREFINEFWVSPTPAEVPSCANSIENSCYW